MLAGRHWLFVAEFSPRMVEEFLRRRIGEIAGMTWSEAAQQVRRLGSLGRGSSRITGPGAGYAPTGSGAYGPAARWSGTAGLT